MDDDDIVTAGESCPHCKVGNVIWTGKVFSDEYVNEHTNVQISQRICKLNDLKYDCSIVHAEIVEIMSISPEQRTIGQVHRLFKHLSEVRIAIDEITVGEVLVRL